MSDIVVIYGTRYGSTQRYADLLGERLDARVVPLASAGAETIASHQTVILATPILAGGFLAAKFATKHRELLAERRWAILVVGMSPVTAQDRTDAVNRAFARDGGQHLNVFHVRGAIDYARLRPHHRVMMSMVNSQMRRTAKKDPTPGHLAAAQLAGQDVDYVDPEALSEIVAWAAG